MNALPQTPARRIPLNPGVFHFVGIGGIGMSGIAEVLHNLDYEVSGSDLTQSANVQRLQALGIPISLGHKPEQIAGKGVIVVSSAVQADNPEVVAARQARIPIVRRADMLAEIMGLKWAIAVAGTHGKTTTTSLVTHMLEAGAFAPTVINGGILEAYGTNARLGEGEWIVAEADESDGTFTRLPATVAVVTNIDPEHMEHYRSVERLHDAFVQFVENVPFYGFAVLCIDHPVVQSLMPRFQDRRALTYGYSPQADVRAYNLRAEADGMCFDLRISERVESKIREIKDLRLAMWGEHNVLNALAAITIGAEFNLSEPAIRQGLAAFKGVKRRFSQAGTWRGVRIIDDYAHHPAEIQATLKSARQAVGKGRIFAVMQPHRYSRLQSLFEDFAACFNDADSVIVTDVYPAGEAPIPGVDTAELVQGILSRGHRDVRPLNAADAPRLAAMLRDELQSGDLVVCMGAGSITTWANQLAGALGQNGETGKSAA